MLLHVGEDLRAGTAPPLKMYFLPPSCWCRPRPGRHGVQQHQLPVSGSGHLLEKTGRMLVTDVFEHADADHLVEFWLRFRGLFQPRRRISIRSASPASATRSTSQCACSPTAYHRRARRIAGRHGSAVRPSRSRCPAGIRVQQCELDQRVVDLGLLGFRQRHVRPGAK